MIQHTTRVDTRRELEEYLTDTAWRGLWTADAGMAPSKLISELAAVLEPVLAEHVATRERLASALRESRSYAGALSDRLPAGRWAGPCTDPRCDLSEAHALALHAPGR